MLDRDGQVRRCEPVRAWPWRIGRGFDCDLVLDDPHVAEQHASLDLGEDGVPWLTVGATRNGVQWDRRTLMPGETVALDSGPNRAFDLGGLRLRLRMPGDAVEPERSLALAPEGVRWWPTLAAGLALWALVLAQHAVALDPGAGLRDWLVPALALPLGLLAWAALWAFSSRLLQRRFVLVPHLALVCRGALVLALADLLLPVLAYALAWPWIARITPALLATIVGATVYAHALRVVPLKRTVLAAGVGGCLLIAGAVVATLNHQRSDRIFDQLYLSVLPPPAFRLAPALPPDALLDELPALQKSLARQLPAEVEDEP
ncbi:FHA domain-containing protein [Aquabacterium sp. J223]|uniref:FHA domain-containing protein n=1 Tax=Aquabacterium sp. J223 TaxID=2898431 RepID=UPI0021ADE250|nr:FHA domain-containing protein [Aquabacterium sp. J223]UUX96729.1 FHA domain-containing protein [Aquabacterium sp. J223]